MAHLIVHTEASDGWGGQEMRVLKELRLMRDKGYRTALVAPEHSEVFKKAKAENFDCWPLRFNKWQMLGDIAALSARFAKERPLMVGTHSSGDSWVGLFAAAFAGVPVKIRYRHVSVPVKKSFFNRVLYKTLPDAIVTTGDCISNALADSFNIPLSKIYTVASGIYPPENVMEVDAARTILQKKLGLRPEDRFIGILAVLRSWKGHQYLIPAFDQISARWPRHHLLIVGDGPNEANLKSFAGGFASRDHIHFLPYHQPEHQCFRGLDLAVLSSTKYEGIPQSLLQAMWVGTPVVGTRVGGIPEIVLQGKTGLVVEPCDINSLAAAMEKVLSNPQAAQARAQAAQENVHKNYSISMTAERVEGLIKAIATRKGIQL